VLTSQVFFDPTGSNRFMPLPKFLKPYMTWRDERVMVQGGGDGDPTVLSPFVRQWNNSTNSPLQLDGKVGSIALPLLADFWYYPDSPDLPKSDPFEATGFNGWQIALAVTSSPRPDFRVYSAGGYSSPGYPRGPKIRRDPSLEVTARGGYTPAGGTTPANDNSVYWIKVDFLKRISVMTYGFFRLADPHRATAINYGGDSRLGPYPDVAAGYEPDFDQWFEPPLSELPVGTAVKPEYRVLDRGTKNIAFELNPLAAGEAHIRENYLSNTRSFDYYFGSAITEYSSNLTELYSSEYLSRFGVLPSRAQWLNFRLVFENNPEASSSVTPAIDSFAMTYRLRKVR
jgi:hypothetical protein